MTVCDVAAYARTYAIVIGLSDVIGSAMPFSGTVSHLSNPPSPLFLTLRKQLLRMNAIAVGGCSPALSKEVPRPATPRPWDTRSGEQR